MSILRASSLITVWTSQSWDDFPIHLTGDDAASLLVSWTALWHPELIASAGSLPQWRRHDNIDETVPNALLTIPRSTRRRLTEAQLEEIQRWATVIESPLDREQDIFQRVLGTRYDHYRQEPWQGLAKLFLSVGYSWLQIHLLTRQLRYSSSLDVDTTAQLVLAAARHCVAEEETETRERLQDIFDALLEERNRYYPVTANLIDLALAHESMAAGLHRQLEREHRQNWLVSGKLWEVIDRNHPELSVGVAAKLASGNLELIGGSHCEIAPQLSAPSTMLADLRRGLETCQNRFGVRPTTYARRRPSLGSILPCLLERLGFSGALHLPFAGEANPEPSAPTFTWQSRSGAQLPAISGNVLDLERPESLLKLGVLIGEQIDSYHSATLVFPHWPGRYHALAEDLFAAIDACELFGRFRLARDVFDGYYNPGYGETFDEDDYRSDFLAYWSAQGVSDPISRHAAYWQAINRLRGIRLAMTLAEVIRGKPLDQHPPTDEWQAVLLEWLVAIDPSAVGLPEHTIWADWQRWAAAALAEAMGCKANNGGGERFVFNSGPIPRAVPIHTLDGPAIIPVPPLGYTIVREGALTEPARLRAVRAAQRMIEDDALQNEFFRVAIDRRTGGVRSVKKFRPRAKNLLSQQIAFRHQGANAGEANKYSRMEADEFDLRLVDEQTAAATTSGRLVLEQVVVGRFRQQVFVRRGFPDIQFTVEIWPAASVELDRWDAYFCSRLAWPSEAVTRSRTVGGQLHPCLLETFVSPGIIVVDDGENSFHFEPLGLPLHRQSSLRTLDTLLITDGERNNRFDFTLRLVDQDWGHRPNLPDTNVLLSAEIPTPVPRAAERNVPRQSKLVRIEPSSLELLDSHSLIEEGQVVGIQILLCDRFNGNGRFRIGIPRLVRRAQAVDFLGNFLHDVEVDAGDACGLFQSYQIFSLRLYW